jgi:hypothetical protein
MAAAAVVAGQPVPRTMAGYPFTAAMVVTRIRLERLQVEAAGEIPLVASVRFA